MAGALRSRRHDESGLTLVELLVTMMLLAVVSTLVVSAVAQTVRVLTQTQDEATGLNDAKVVLDRLGRDIREARGVVCLPDPTDPECKAHLQLWIDSNSDYALQDEEIVTWKLLPNPDSVHYDVWRYVGPEGAHVAEHRQASSLIVEIAFCYDDNPDPVLCAGFYPEVEQIRIRMQYDALIGRGTELRDVGFAVRLRNK
jgi:prepilin-type N-terminal cleavage/methylation domain-containing protein